MEGQLAAPFHFAVEFLILAVFAGAMFDAMRPSRERAGGVAFVQAAGFASLILAQILHGTLVLTGDGALPLVIMRGIGFGLIAASMRPMPAAALPESLIAALVLKLCESRLRALRRDKVALALVPLFAWASVRAIRQGEPMLLLYAAPAIIMLGLHGAMAHHYTRYNLILVGPFAVGAAWMIADWLQNARARLQTRTP